MRGIGEDRLVQKILPVAGKLLLGRDLAGDGARTSAGAAHYDSIADFRGARGTKRQRIEIDAAERLYQAEAAFGIEAQRVTFHNAPISEMKPDRLGFSNEIADGQHQPILDQDAVARAFGAECFRAESIWRDDRMQPDHRRKHTVQVKTVVARARLKRRRHFPFSQGRHGNLLAYGAPCSGYLQGTGAR